MFYTIYEVRCTENGKTYVGKHATRDLDDGYLGSGKLLRRAIRKYGRSSFEKKILFVFPTEQEMSDKEAEIVTDEFCSSDGNYNLARGGRGGWEYVNSTMTKEERRRISALGGYKDFSSLPIKSQHSIRTMHSRRKRFSNGNCLSDAIIQEMHAHFKSVEKTWGWKTELAKEMKLDRTTISKRYKVYSEIYAGLA